MKSMRRREATAAIVAAALCAFTAQAFALPPPPYAVVDLAYSMIGLEASGIEKEGFQTSGSDRRATGFAITLGWRFSPHLAAEGTFLVLGGRGIREGCRAHLVGRPIQLALNV